MNNELDTGKVIFNYIKDKGLSKDCIMLSPFKKGYKRILEKLDNNEYIVTAFTGHNLNDRALMAYAISNKNLLILNNPAFEKEVIKVSLDMIVSIDSINAIGNKVFKTEYMIFIIKLCHEGNEGILKIAINPKIYDNVINELKIVLPTINYNVKFDTLSIDEKDTYANELNDLLKSNDDKLFKDITNIGLSSSIFRK